MRYEFFIEDNNNLILDLKKESLNKLGNINFKTDLNYFFRDVVCGEFNRLDHFQTKNLLELLLTENVKPWASKKKFNIEGNSLPSLIYRLQDKISDAVNDNKGIIIAKGYDFKKKHFKKTIMGHRPKEIITNLPIYFCEITYKDEDVYAGLLKWADIEEKIGPITSKWVAYPSPFEGLIIRTEKYTENFEYGFYMYTDFNEHSFDVIKKTIELEKSISR